MSFCRSGVEDNCPNYPSGEGAVNLFLTLINSLYAAKCSFDYSDKYPNDYGPYLEEAEEYDFIVIGGGSSGSVVANILSENPNWRVLVLEAGYIPSTTSEIPGLTPRDWGNEDYQYRVQPNRNALLSLKDRRARWLCGKLLGGSSSLNQQFYLRGQDLTYDEWAALGNTGWDYKSVLPYFLKNENMTSDSLTASYGTTGYQKLLHDRRTDDPIAKVLYKAVPELGVRILRQEGGPGFWEGVCTNYGGERWNAGKSFLGLVRNRGNLYVSYGSFVERVLMSGNTARGVFVNIQGRRINITASEEVIICAGVVNSPKLLLLSGIGPRRDLERLGIRVIKNLPVGRNVIDHVIYTQLVVKMTKWKYDYPNKIDDIFNYILYRNSTNLAIGPHKLLLGLQSPNSSKVTDGFFITSQPRGLFDEVYSTGRVIEVEEAFNYTRQVNKKYPLVTFAYVYLNPTSRGKIVLNSTNPYDPPLIFHEYLQYEKELDEMLIAIRFVENLTKTAPFKRLGGEVVYIPIGNCPGLIPGSDAYWKCALRNYATSGRGQVGSCKMGINKQAVVSPTLKVRGVNRLRVVDASVIPTPATSGTYAPVLMVAQKGGRIIQEYWLQRGT